MWYALPCSTAALNCHMSVLFTFFFFVVILTNVDGRLVAGGRNGEEGDGVCSAHSSNVGCGVKVEGNDAAGSRLFR